MKHILPLLLAILIVSCSKSDQPANPDVVTVSDLLPRDNEISGWLRVTGAEGSWQATNTSELQQRIDGGFELFSNHGFVEGAMQTFTGRVNTETGVSCEVQIYDQNTAEQADAVFDDPNNVFTNPVMPSNPPSARAQIQKDIFSHTMKFTKGRYYVRMSIVSVDDKAPQVLEVFASNIATRIK